MKFNIFLILAPTLLFESFAFGEPTARFNSEKISFSYSSANYSSISSSIPEQLCTNSESACLEVAYLTLKKRKAMGGNRADSGTVCLGSVAECANQRPDFGYYANTEGEVNVAPPGENKITSRLGKWEIVESFLLCGWSNSSGRHQPYGGQCYSLALISEDKTVGFNFLIGKAGCKNISSCWPDEISRIRKMIGSVK